MVASKLVLKSKFHILLPSLDFESIDGEQPHQEEAVVSIMDSAAEPPQSNSAHPLPLLWDTSEAIFGQNSLALGRADEFYESLSSRAVLGIFDLSHGIYC